MDTAADLLDLHRRTHACLGKALDHCAGFAPEDLRRELPGFGYPTLLQQLHHAVSAERYWVGVALGRMLDDEVPEEWASLDAVRALRERTVAATRAWLGAASDAELRTRRPLTTSGGAVRELVPMHLLLRTQTHVFHHLGQVAAMCRLLGRPVPPGMDFPLGA